MQDKLQFINFIAFLLKLNWNILWEISFHNQMQQNCLLILLSLFFTVA